MAIFNATVGLDNPSLTGSDDTVNLEPTTLNSGDIFDAKNGNDSLILTAAGTYNFNGVTLTSFEIFTGSAGTDVVIMTAAQYTSFINTLSNANLTGIETFSAAGSATAVTINLGSQTEAFTIIGGNAGDTITGGSAGDTITAGTGADTVNGGAGNDTFVIVASDLASGESIDGGGDTDTVRIDGGGTVDLSLATLTNVENVTLTDTTGTNITVTAAQAALITSAAGTTDVVNISGNFNTDTALVKQLLDAGVEQVRWTSSVYGSATAIRNPSDATQFIVTYNDTDVTRPFDYLRTTYNASGERVAQTQLFDTGLDNGVLQQLVFDPATGGVVSNTLTDTLGTRSFHTISNDFTNGVRSHTRTINDYNTATNTDDVIVDQYFDAGGVITLELQTDASPGGTGKPWASVAREYVGGVTQIFRTTFDNGNQHVAGQAGAQNISGGTGNDSLIGGGGSDAFVFGTGVFGNDTVYDFVNGTDKLDFRARGIDTLAELQGAAATIANVGTNLVIDFGGGSSVKILNFNVASLDDTDFVI